MVLNHYPFKIILGLLLTLSLTACSSSGTDAEASANSVTTDDTAPNDSEDGTDGVNNTTCTTSGFSEGPSASTSNGTSWGMDILSADGTALLYIDSFADWNGPTVAGDYDLGGINYRDCGLCLLMFADCTSGQDCQTVYYADTGLVSIKNLDMSENGQVDIDLSRVIFTEVTISNTDYTSTPVADARTWCIDHSFSGTFTDPDKPDVSGATAPEVADAACVVDGNGAGIGANLPDFTLTNCHGEEVNIHSLACSEEASAVWFVASADWCGPCHAYADIAKERLDAGNQAGVVLVEVIGEDISGNPATLETCQGYADQHGLDYTHVFFDAGWQALFGNLWPYPTVSGTMYYPWVGIARGGNLEYLYSSQFNSADFPNDAYSGEGLLDQLAGVPGPADGDTQPAEDDVEDTDDSGGSPDDDI
ncbi:MAG: hypothetical protein VX834_11745 [Myxococcota bacterium]|nr:hypothetical protein [Myxococcota bacterium]